MTDKRNRKVSYSAQPMGCYHTCSSKFCWSFRGLPRGLPCRGGSADAYRRLPWIPLTTAASAVGKKRLDGHWITCFKGKCSADSYKRADGHHSKPLADISTGLTQPILWQESDATSIFRNEKIESEFHMFIIVT